MKKTKALTQPSPMKTCDDYEVDSAVDCLLRAEEIKQNKPLMEKVMERIGKKEKAIRSIQDLKDAKNAAYEGDEEAGEEDDSAEEEQGED